MVFYTDASPEELVHSNRAPRWHTLAGVGIQCRENLVSSAIPFETILGTRARVRLLDARQLLKQVGGDDAAEMVHWKDLRARKRAATKYLKRIAAQRECWLFAHSSRSDVIQAVRQMMYPDGDHLPRNVRRQNLVLRPELLVSQLPSYRDLEVPTFRIESLIWIVHSLIVFYESVTRLFPELGPWEAVFVHDRLPGNRPQDVEIINALLNEHAPGRILFVIAESRAESFLPDHLAGLANAFASGKSLEIQSWIAETREPLNLLFTFNSEAGAVKQFF